MTQSDTPGGSYPFLDGQLTQSDLPEGSEILCQACRKTVEGSEMPKKCPHCGVNALIWVHPK